MSEEPSPRLYGDLASWFHLLTAPEDYEEEAAVYRAVIDAASPRATRRVLELGSGGGNNASHLKARYEMTLVDRSAPMLAQSRALNPECEHALGDMRSVRLDRTFDAVFIHDAVSHITSLDDLAAVFATAAAHLDAGGVVLAVPDDLAETFTGTTRHGGHDGTDGRALRYLEWSWDPDPDDSVCRTDLTYVLRDGDEMEVVHDVHHCGLFTSDQWIAVMDAAGFEARREDRDIGEEELHPLFVGVRRRG